MLINDLMDLAADVPTHIAFGWAAWLAVGLVLTIWHRRARAALVYDNATPRQAAKPKSGERPPSGARAPKAAPAAAPASVGDPFGDLETLLDEHVGSHRTPGESPILSSAGSPVLRAADQPAMADSKI